jgi:dihydrodipicolinate synthase/N-acetylneuraminate lyase
VVPLVTSFTDQLTIDEAATEKLVHYIIGAGCLPFVLGTTGEAVSITRLEKRKVVAATVQATKGRCLVYAGISGNCLYDSIEEARAYHDTGVDVCVATMPYYYAVEADGMIRYFEQLAEAIPCPLVLYNIPATTHLSLPLEVVDRLSHHPNIAGFKDSEKGLERMEAAIGLWKDREDFSYLLGWAAMSQRALSMGADGIVPSSGNLVPAVYQKIYTACLEGHTEEALQAQRKGDILSEKYQKDRLLSKAFPVFKAMLSAYGLCPPNVLPPLYRVPAAEEKKICADLLQEYPSLDELNHVSANFLTQTTNG